LSVAAIARTPTASRVNTLAQHVVDLAPGGLRARAPVAETDRTGSGDNDGGCLQ
jgi:hypothetical protein